MKLFKIYFYNYVGHLSFTQREYAHNEQEIISKYKDFEGHKILDIVEL